MDSSAQQVSRFLFDVLGLSMPAGMISKTKTDRSTSNEILLAIKAEAAKTGTPPKIIDIILEFRELNKQLTSFIRPLPELSRKIARSRKAPSIIYPQWMQTTVDTGRLSCRKPNIQQQSKKRVFGVSPRDAFVATREGWCLFACDYSQKEIRILAHMSGDQALISLFRGDPKVDIYKQMTSLIRNKPVEAVTDSERAQFKTTTLALLYGQSPGEFGKKLKISKTAAEQLKNDFFRRFPRVKVNTFRLCDNYLFGFIELIIAHQCMELY